MNNNNNNNNNNINNNQLWIDLWCAIEIIIIIVINFWLWQLSLLFLPAEGKKHDASMLVDSNLLHELEQNAFSPTGEPMCVFGDPAYPLRVHLQAPFRHGILTPMMEGYNAEMSSVRVTVEWLFGDFFNDFKFLDFKKNLKIGMSSVGKMYLVCALLNNAITCLYGNSTSEFFGLNPPSLQDYFT